MNGIRIYGIQNDYIRIYYDVTLEYQKEVKIGSERIGGLGEISKKERQGY